MFGRHPPCVVAMASWRATGATESTGVVTRGMYRRLGASLGASESIVFHDLTDKAGGALVRGSDLHASLPLGS